MVILRSHFLNQTYDGSDSGTLPVGSFNYCFPMDIDNTKSMGFRKCHGSTQDVRVKKFLTQTGQKTGDTCFFMWYKKLYDNKKVMRNFLHSRNFG